MTSKSGDSSVSVGLSLRHLRQETLTSVAGDPPAPPPSERDQTALSDGAPNRSFNVTSSQPATQTRVPGKKVKGGASEHGRLINPISHLLEIHRKNKKHIADHSFEQSRDYPTIGERIRTTFGRPSKARSSVVDGLDLDPIPEPMYLFSTEKGSHESATSGTTASKATSPDGTGISGPSRTVSSKHAKSSQLPKVALSISDTRTKLPPTQGRKKSLAPGAK